MFLITSNASILVNSFCAQCKRKIFETDIRRRVLESQFLLNYHKE